MVELWIGDQLIRYDAEATAAVYRGIARGDADECGCLSCQNFAAQRSSVFPASFTTLLQQLGVDTAKEGEVYEAGGVDSENSLYGGWFYLRGELVKAGENTTKADDREGFEFWFTRSGPQSKAFQDGPAITIEFYVVVLWILPGRTVKEPI